VYSVVPERDFAPKIDKQRGLVQYITCPHENGSIGCHRIVLTLCNLASACHSSSSKPLFEPFPDFNSTCSS
jgi:hypothetical protein